MLNAKLLHQVQSLPKVVTELVLPHVVHINPLHFHIGILLILDDIQIDLGLGLVPEQFTPSDSGAWGHIGVKLPETDILCRAYLIHTPGGLLMLASGGLDIALGRR